MEEVHRHLGGWGPYQTRVILLIFIPIFSKGMQTMVAIIIFHVPDHRCRVPGWPEDTYRIQSEEHRAAVNQTIPQDQHGYSQCSVFSAWNHTTVNNHSQQEHHCHDWVYDESEVDDSLITQFDLVCDRKTFRAHLNMVFLAGTLLGDLVTGYLCDLFGRKTIFYISNLVCLAVGVAAVFPPNLLSFMIYRVIAGAAGGTVYLSVFVLLMELVGSAKRTRAASLLTMVWLCGPLVLDAVSYLVRQWQYLQVISVAPLVFCLAHWWLLPESPRWLLIKGKTKAAIQVLQKVAEVNKTPFSLTSDCVASCQEQLKEEESSMQILRVALQMHKRLTMVLITAIVSFNWGVIAMAYYGLSLNVGNLGGSLRVNFFLSSAVEMAGYGLAWVLLDRLGRKRCHCLFTLTAGLACLATILTVSLGGKELEWLTITLAMVGKLGISASFTSIYLITAEIYPTVIRNFSLAFCSSWGRIGSMVSPYVADLGLYVGGRFSDALPLVVFGGLSLLAGLSALYLPETLHRALPDTLTDAVAFVHRGDNNNTLKTSEASDDCDNEEEDKARNLLLTDATSAL